MSDANDLIFGNSVEGAKFDRIGDEIQGRIVKIWDKQQTRKYRVDGKLGDLEYWDDDKTQPIWQTRIDLQTDLRDPRIQYDTGIRAVYIRASSEKQRATKEAVLATGEHSIEVGAWYGLRMVGEEENGTNNPKKLFQAMYRPPASEAIMDTPPVQQQAPLQQQYQQPVQAQNPIQQAYNQQQGWGQQPAQQQPQPGSTPASDPWANQSQPPAQWPSQPQQQAPVQQQQGWGPPPQTAQQQLAQAQQQYGIPNPAPNMNNPAQGQVGMQQPAANPANDPAVQALLNQVANNQPPQQ